ncbi:hypothetical protein RND71_012934 [Anisodus tanguticus]|uniref:Uncharacterized protein n=1 Tax=Anisodus tanguticus TaxID=243964 RepID=A0AAE1VHF4_9SOLA|nr:hypothetical protein RND71_012934 [Anisodus tanguticus]
MTQHLLPVEINCEHNLEEVFKTISCLHGDFDIHLNKWQGNIGKVKEVLEQSSNFNYDDMSRLLGSNNSSRKISEAIELLNFVKDCESRSNKIIIAASIVIDCKVQHIDSTLDGYHVTEPSWGIRRILVVTYMKQFIAFQKEIQFVFGLRQEVANVKEATIMDSDMLNNAVAKLAAEVAKLSDVLKMNHALVLNERICSKSLALIGCTENVDTLPLVDVSLTVYSNSMTKVWDPGWQWCIHSSIFLSHFALAVAISIVNLFYNHSKKNNQNKDMKKTGQFLFAYQCMSLAYENGWHVLLGACALGPKDMGSLEPSYFHPKSHLCSSYKTSEILEIEFIRWRTSDILVKAFKSFSDELSLWILAARLSEASGHIVTRDNFLGEKDLHDEFVIFQQMPFLVKFLSVYLWQDEADEKENTPWLLIVCLPKLILKARNAATPVFALLQQLQVQLLLFACAYLEVNIDLMVMSVASYEAALMELHCGTLPRGYDEHHNVAKSVMDSKNDSKHVKQFFKYVQLPFLNNAAAIRLNYSNLEDKVLIGVGSIVMNGPDPILVKQPNTKLSGLVGIQVDK